MLTLGFPAAAFDTNCFLLAPAAGEECVIVDPGIGVLDQLAEVLREFRLRPAAVLLTHGHIDHVYSVTPVCRGGGDLGFVPPSASPDANGELPAYIHGDDRYRLRDPLRGIDAGLRHMLEAQFGRAATWTQPSNVVELTDGSSVSLAGLDFRIHHAPGHTEGSVMFSLATIPDQLAGQCASTLVSGDVLFAGSIGRCDLPGGDERAMQRSLRDVVLPMPDDRLVLPGHGPLTTIGQERATNPYLRQLRSGQS
ncbi:MAG: MBL fold metallo-hydrolase [Dermatophilaceae bacterium]